MKKTKLCVILICAFSAILVLSGCQNTVKVDPAPDIRIERDLSVEPPVTYDVTTNPEDQNVSFGIIEYIMGTDVSAISEYSSDIVRGVVQKVVFTSYDGNAFTAVDLAVDECYKGDLQHGDLITILYSGGYIPKNHQIVHEAFEAEPFPQAGDHNIYFLNPANPKAGLPAKAYQRSRGVASVFRVEPDGKSVSRINPDMPAGETGETEPYGNETFSLQEIVDDIASAN